MHLIVGAEAYPENHKEFINYVRRLGSRYKKNIASKNPHWGVKVREFRFFDLVFPEEYKDQFMKDIGWWYKNDQRFLRVKDNYLVKKFIQKANVDPIEGKELIQIKQEIQNDPNIHRPKNSFQMYLYPFGIIKDRHFGDQEKDQFRRGFRKRQEMI